MDKLLSIRAASRLLGVSNGTLRRWEKESRLVPERTAGGQRRYPLSSLRPHLVRAEKIDRKTLCYARVSSHDQRQDLERQKQVLEMYCAAQGWKFETIADLGSGMNYNEKGLKVLISAILDREAGRLVLTHKDRLLT